MNFESVRKRIGTLELFDLEKLVEGVSKATSGLEFNIDEFVSTSLLNLPSLPTTEQIRSSLIKTAVERITLKAPIWDKIATRLFLQKIFKEVSINLGDYDKFKKRYSETDFCLRDYLQNGIRLHKLTPKLERFYSRNCAVAIKNDRNYQFTYLGVKTLYDKYLIKAQDKTALETPQQMFMGISMFLAMKDDDYESLAIRYYDVLSTFKAMLATPILSNARTPRFQLNSCYVGSCGDNIESIFTSFKDMALISKNGGGIGWDFSRIRGMGSSIDGITGVGGGIIPWLKITNDIAIAVDQLGTRKGAIATWCEIWHIDIEDFIELRKNSGDERRRAHDLFPALWICDLFMSRVQSNGYWTLFDPYYFKKLSDTWGGNFERLYEEYETVVHDNPKLLGYKTIKARDLWKKILTQVFETGLPFVGFKDTANRTNMNKNSGVIRSSNLCTEIFQNTKPSELKLKVVYDRHNFDRSKTITTEHSNFYNLIDEDSLSKVRVVSNGEDQYLSVLDLRPGDEVRAEEDPYEYYDTVKFVAKQSAEDGITAVCTLGSVNLSKLEFFDKDKTFNQAAYADLRKTLFLLVRMLNNVIDLNSYPIETAKNSQDNNRAIGIGIMGEAELMATNKIRYGSKEHQALINNIMESISYNVIEASSCIVSAVTPPYPNYSTSKWAAGVMPYNLNRTSIPEPRDLALPSIPRDAFCDWSYLAGTVSKKGIRNGYLLAVAPTSSISILCGTTQSIEPYYSKFWYEENISGLIPAIAPGWTEDKDEYFVTAYEVDPKEIINLAAIRQQWIDQGQSLNLFVNPNISGKELNDLYMSAWLKGLKSVYYCRTKSKEITSNSIVSCSIDCESCQ